jgi:iron complex outermembrane receptor protein
LKIAPAFGLSSASVTLRGIGNGNEGTYVDQSVALNLDGMTVGSGIFFRSGIFDIGQVEVLKGPQSLFFGKSSSGGLIAIHSADPTKEWDTKVTVGYEFNADEMDLDGYISGPVTDDLGVRLAGYHNTMKGYFYNPNPNNPKHRLPESTDDGFRGTLKYDNPDTGLRIKFKGSYSNHTQNVENPEITQSVCSTGVNTVTPGLGAYDNCKVDQYTSGLPSSLPYSPTANFSPFNQTAFNSFTPDPVFRDGKSYAYAKAALGVLNIDYDITPGLTISSVTGLDWGKNADAGRAANAALGFDDIGTNDTIQEFSEELRLTSNWKDRWYNFMVGGLYSDAKRRTHLVVSLPAFPGAFLTPLLAGNLYGLYTDDIEHATFKNNSVFGQVLLTPIEHWELSAGLRYTHNSKRFTSLQALSTSWQTLFAGLGFPPAPPAGEGIGLVGSPSNPYKAENATTPEFTLKYTPTDDITAFVSYKQGYKGLGFNSNPATYSYAINDPTSSNYNNVVGFSGERVKGVEGGVKAQMLDRQLSLSVTGYLYNYKALQVSFIDAAANRATINNGANARVQGVELTADYSPEAIQGLSFNGFLNYNDGHYTSFPNAGCYSGQTAATGCAPSSTLGALGTQNLAGKPLVGAPKWTGTFGFTYKKDLSEKYMASFHAETQYSSSYAPDSEENPLTRQHSYALVDLALHLSRTDNTWDLGLICRNCTDHYYIIFANDAGPFVGSVANISVARPREVLLQLTVHPNLL